MVQSYAMGGMAAKRGRVPSAVLYVGYLLSIITVVQTDFQELCQTQTFRVQCAKKNEVIFIKSALYGRMRFGQCVKKNYGHVGCKGNVIEHADRRCSGKRKCEIRIPDAAFEKTKTTCPDDLEQYFQVYYDCLEVVLPREELCDTSLMSAIILTEPSGYLANAITERHGFGSLNCPWHIKVLRGQRINITLLDFSTPTSDIRPHMFESKICYQYAIITEVSSVNTLNDKICGGNIREKVVYTSRTNSVHIRILTSRNVQEDREFHFLFKYEAFGCPEPEPPQHGWMIYNAEGVTMGCNHTELTWRMICEGTEWVGPSVNCSAVAEVNSSGAMMLWGTISIPYGVSVGIMGGLAAIVGVIILLVGLICAEWRKVKRSRRLEKARFTELQQRRDDVSSIRSGSAKGEHDEYHQQRTSTYISAGTMKPSTSDQNAKERDKEKEKEKEKVDKTKEDDYMREMWPMAPPPGNLFDDTLFDSRIDEPEPMSPIFGCDSMELTQPEAFSPEEEEFTQPHIYETPRPLRRNKSDPQYFEVDSKGTLPRNTLPARYKPAAVVGLDDDDDDDLMDNRRS